MTIALRPDPDGDCVLNLRQALRDAGDESVTIDLGKISMLSSGALIELMHFRRRNSDRRIVLEHPNPVILRTLNIVGMTKHFTIQPAR